MKLKNILSCTITITGIFLAAGCTKVLKEQPRASIDPSFFKTTEGIQGGIAGIYSSFRGLWGTQAWSQLFNAGNDEVVKGGSADVTQWFTFNTPLIKSASTADYSGMWNNMFLDINTANGVLKYGVDANIDAATKTQLLAQAKFLRAFCYFYLVTTFGDVPLHLEFNTEPVAADTRAPIADVYAAIIKDLTEAAADLPNLPTATTGKPATKPTALFLLAKTYLWRGWSSAAQASDFTNAFTTAKSVIDNKATYNLDLMPLYNDVFREGNEYGKEILMVIDHTKDLKFGQNSNVGAGAQNGQENKSNFFWRPNYPTINGNYPASGGSSSLVVRDIQNGRPFLRIRPNMRYLLDVAFANRATDQRYDGTFQTIWIARNTTVPPPGPVTPRGTLVNNVDTAIWLVDRVVTPAERAAFKGVILEPEHLPGVTVPFTGNMFPSLRKWDDSTRGDVNDYSDRPYILFRFAELYLIAAEAAFKGGGTTQQAADMINVLRTRAALKLNQSPAQYATALAAQQITPAQVTLDFILDERTREMYGEATRWWDLSRTKTLVPRVVQYNLEAGPTVNAIHMLRPIPQSQIDLVTEGPKFPQNPGYE